MRLGQSEWLSPAEQHVGTSLQLLPPTAPAPSAAAISEPVPAAAAGKLALAPPSSDASLTPAAPSFVTRDNAELKSVQHPWHTTAAAALPTAPELALQPRSPGASAAPDVQTPHAPQRTLNAPQVQLNPPEQLAKQATAPAQVAPPELPNFANGPRVSTAADRHNDPAWSAPPDASSLHTARADKSTSDPAVPATTFDTTDRWAPRGEAKPSRTRGRDATPNTTPSNATDQAPSAIGSGVKSAPLLTPPKTLAPVQQMPSLEAVLPSTKGSHAARTNANETAREASMSEPDTAIGDEALSLDALLDDAGEMSLGSPTLTPPSRTNAKAGTNVNDGNNEGSESDSLPSDERDGLEPEPLHDDSSLQPMLENSVESDAPASTKGSPKSPKSSLPELSTTPIKQLVPDPTAQLQAVQDKADLRDVRQDAAATASPQRKTIQDVTPLPLERLSQLDATGRVKTYSGPQAVADLPPAIARLQRPILQTLRTFHARTELADARSNWGMMHSIMVYGADTRIIARRRNYSAIAWIAGNNVCRGNRLMTTAAGNIKVREGTGLQGHQAQFLAVLSLAGVPADYPLYADNQKFAIEDLVQVEAAACEDGKELTFTLIGLAHYLDTEATWTGVGGESWDFSRLIAAELNEPVVGAACGGTHRLMGFAHALRKRRLEGRPIDGQWKRAEDFLNDFVPYTYSLQNRDGSFSTNWYESRQDNGDLQRKVQTTGHMLEFLLTHLPDEDLVSPPVVAAVRFLIGAMGRVELNDAGVGYRGHALRALAMYHRRVYGVAPNYPPPSVATNGHRHQHRR